MIDTCKMWVMRNVDTAGRASSGISVHIRPARIIASSCGETSASCAALLVSAAT
jgi:hypothetical protein